MVRRCFCIAEGVTMTHRSHLSIASALDPAKSALMSDAFGEVYRPCYEFDGAMWHRITLPYRRRYRTPGTGVIIWISTSGSPARNVCNPRSDTRVSMSVI